jgi:16S rRNA (uracil1498-N3)-methyltransferase
MADPRFYCETLSYGEIRLAGPQADHARRARRLSVDDKIILFDGQGSEATGTIASLESGAVLVKIEQLQMHKRKTPSLTLAAALPKGSRQDTLVEKSTELGVAAIQPLNTERSLATANTHKIDKWRRNVIEAAKQSQQCWIPQLHPPCNLETILRRIGEFDRTLVATVAGECSSAHTKSFLQAANELISCQNVLTLVGPEGGWTEQELSEIIKAGGQPVNLGPNILRVETAAITLATMIHAIMN